MSGWSCGCIYEPWAVRSGEAAVISAVSREANGSARVILRFQHRCMTLPLQTTRLRLKWLSFTGYVALTGKLAGKYVFIDMANI